MFCYLAIDQGTHASRALLFDEHGHCLDTESQAIDLIRKPGGRVEHDSDQVLASVGQVVERLTARRRDIRACGIATQRSTVLAWRSDGTALGRALSWQDVRGAAQIEALSPHGACIRQITGLPLSPHYGASKLHWLLSESAAVRRCPPVRRRLSPLVSFLLYHLLEQRPYRIDHSNAQRTQLLDLSTLDWSSRLCEWFDVPLAYLPDCAPMCHPHGTLAGSGIPVTAVCGDQNAAFYGAGEPSEDTALVNLGSGAFILRPLQSRRPSADQLTGLALSGADGVRYLREATVNGAGSALDWAERHWRIPALQTHLPKWLESVGEPPLFINSVGGLAAPWWREDIEPELIAAAGEDGDGPRAVAVVESILFLLQANLERMQAESPLRRLRVSGGLSSLDGLCRKLAALSGLPVTRVDDPQATARGAAWLAAGRPRSWLREATGADFAPRADARLRDRYRRFRDALAQRLRQARP